MNGADLLMPTYRRWPLRLVSGSGARVMDAAGRSYIDLTAGIAVASVGHAHPEVARAVAEQAARLVHVSNLYETEPQLRLAHRLAEVTGGMHSFFCNSGAEAVECALKLARKNGGRARRRIVAMDGAFHGRTFGALSATGQPAKQEPFGPIVPAVDHVAFGDVDALQRALGDTVAAVVVEPIQGEAGVVVPPPGYLAAVRSLCDAHGVLLVVDEVQTGIGRTGKWFAYEHDAIRPDIVCLAKALGGGFPIGACLARPEVAAAFEPGDHGTTFGGGPVQSAAALAVLDVVASEHLVERAVELGARMIAALRRIVPSDAAVRGRGLLIGIELGTASARSVAAAALERGVLVNDATPSVLRISPPLVISDDDVDKALHTLEEVFRENRTP